MTLKRKMLSRIALYTMLPTSIFGAIVIVMIMDAVGISFFTEVASFFKEDPLGLAIIGVGGIFSLVFCISLVLRWREGEKLKGLRYELLSYLRENRRITGKRTPIQVLAESVGADRRDVLLALDVMIYRKELRGRIDPSKDIYVHNSVTKKGILLSKLGSRIGRR